MFAWNIFGYGQGEADGLQWRRFDEPTIPALLRVIVLNLVNSG